MLQCVVWGQGGFCAFQAREWRPSTYDTILKHKTETPVSVLSRRFSYAHLTNPIFVYCIILIIIIANLLVVLLPSFSFLDFCVCCACIPVYNIALSVSLYVYINQVMVLQWGADTHFQESRQNNVMRGLNCCHSRYLAAWGTDGHRWTQRPVTCGHII